MASFLALLLYGPRRRLTSPVRAPGGVRENPARLFGQSLPRLGIKKTSLQPSTFLKTMARIVSLLASTTSALFVKRARIGGPVPCLADLPDQVLKKIDSYERDKLSLRSVCRWTRAVLMIPAALLALVPLRTLRSLERGAARLGLAPLAGPTAVVQEQSWLHWLRSFLPSPPLVPWRREVYSQHPLAVYSRAHRAGLPTAGLWTVANGYKNKSKAGVPQCRCNDRERTKCLKPTCPNFDVPKEGSPGNWHHPQWMLARRG